MNGRKEKRRRKLNEEIAIGSGPVLLLLSCVFLHMCLKVMIQSFRIFLFLFFLRTKRKYMKLIARPKSKMIIIYMHIISYHIIFTIRASPTSVPMAMEIMKRSISWYALNFVNGTIAIPTKPHNEMIVIEATAAIHAR